MEKDNFYAKIAKLALEIGIIFGLPAILAGFGSSHFHLSKGRTAMFLGLAFVFSWVVFLVRYKNIIKGQ